ncbi:hypothetical protein [Candidatus Solirubrobacter pratensis]|uniref:hypothetical protein n=1 Tax=Candidatus Solirubrobacter pratensis TaxID=1298857 RepID=UPI0004249C1C|nr:hypothetical protein [Candidatus Solirubrobacter pratensis]
MVVASAALFMSLGGTSMAAVSFARNAGAVDGKSAVSASGTVSHAAGRLVATNKSGPDKGMLPGKFLAGVPHTQTFGKSFEVADNAPGAPLTIGNAAGVGNLTATCNDQNGAAGIEDPTTTLNFVNTSGQIINIARRVGVGDGAVGLLANQTVAPLTISGSNTFFYHVQTPQGVNLLINGVVRQDGRGAPAANCLVYGTVLEIS